MSKGLVWLRRDMRLWDNHALSKACLEMDEVYVVFVFDSIIIDSLPEDDHRVQFLFEAISELKESVNILYGNPVERIPWLCEELNIDKLFVNRDYEQYAIKRDQKVENLVFDKGINFESYKDQVLFEQNEVLTGKGEMYKVFTPYKNKVIEKLELEPIKIHSVDTKKIRQASFNEVTSLESINKQPSRIAIPSIDAPKQVKDFIQKISDYKDKRDFPALPNTSRLSVFLRFGQLSVRSLYIRAAEQDNEGSATWRSELIWRDFYSALLQGDPSIENEPFNKKYKNFIWDKDAKLLKLWKKGQTGFPIVDAGMRELNQTGFMHNRVRMVVASFLTKILKLDYREGEAYFAKMLFDYDLASNNGGWQWSASTGADAAPYFRVFNPYRQSERFDKNGDYIKKYVPELKNVSGKSIHKPEIEGYPSPIVDYASSRAEIIKRFKDHA